VKVLMVGQLCFSSLLGVFYRRVEVWRLKIEEQWFWNLEGLKVLHTKTPPSTHPQKGVPG
jgi:hypothetical protein